MRKAHTEYNFKDGEYEEKPYPYADGNGERRTVEDVLYLLCKDGEVRLRNGNKHTHDKANEKEKLKFPRLGKARADLLAHRSHSDVCAKVE